MKKIFFVLTMLLFSGLLFAENSLKDYIAEFLNKGSYTVGGDDSSAEFFPKHAIIDLRYDSEDFAFTCVDKEGGYREVELIIEDYSITIDKNSNIIISEK